MECPAKKISAKEVETGKVEECQKEQRIRTIPPDHIALFDAVKDGDITTLKRVILEKNISANIKDENDMTPLLQAACKGSYEICEFLLKQGAEVNATSHKNFYTPLMMAALSGKKDVVKLLFDAGANVNAVNNNGKTAAEIAGFVGNREIATIIKNYLTMEKFEPYFTPQGCNPPRIEESQARILQEIVMATNYHPVKIVIAIQENSALCNLESLKKSTGVLEDLCRKCVRAKNDFDEILTLKLHYVSSVFQLCRDHLAKDGNKSLHSLLKTLMRENESGEKLACENVVRQSLMCFPYTDIPLFQYLVKMISETEQRGQSTALHFLQSTFNGIHAMRDPETWCRACGDREAKLVCSACKNIRYCGQNCQKLNWSIHKKKCSQRFELKHGE